MPRKNTIFKEPSLDSKQVRLPDWQLADADIAAAHGNYAKAVLGLREVLQQVETEMHTNICLISN